MAARRKARKGKDNSVSDKMRKEIESEIGNVDFKTKMEGMMREYGHYVVQNRAIPDVNDGLKPVHRRVLWAVHHLGAYNSSKTIKTARVSGDTIGKYHPHGSAAVDDAINGMVQGSTFPTLHGQGNFGSYSQPAAAARYTEVKFLKQTEQLLFNPYYLKVAPLVATYDGKETEPVWLPAMLPLVLATGAIGMAVGVTTKIPAFTVKSLHEVTMAILAGEKDTKVLAKKLEMASPYGGKPTGTWKDLHRVFTSKEAVQLGWTCDYQIINDEKMVITGFHPEWSFKSKFQKMRDDPDVAEAIDMSSKKGIELVIKVKKKADPDKVFDRLMKMCVGDITYRCNITKRSLDTEPELPEVKTQFASVSPYEVIQQWLKWRLRLEQLALRQEMIEVRDTMLREKLILLACRSIDVIFLLLKKKGIDKVAELSKKLKISEDDAKTIWSIAVGRLDKLSETVQIKRIKELQERASQIKEDFANPKKPVMANLKSLSL